MKDTVDLNELLHCWNKVLSQIKAPDLEMTDDFQKLQLKYNESLRIVKNKNMGVYVRNFRDLPVVIDELWLNKPAISYKYREWLIFRELLDGYTKNDCAFLKVWINDDNGNRKLFLINNEAKRSAWNDRGYKKTEYKSKYTFINESGLFEKIEFPRVGKKRDPITGKSVNIRHPTKLRIINELRLMGYKYPKGWNKRKNWFFHVYTLKYSIELIDEYLEFIYLKELRFRGYKDTTVLNQIHKHYDEFTNGITSINKYFHENLENNERFCLFFREKGSELNILLNYLTNNVKKDIKDSISDWINKIEEQITVEDLAKMIQKIEFTSLIKSEIEFDLISADKYVVGGISRDYDRFWDERYSNGFSGFAKALIEDSSIRRSISEFTNKSDKLPPLNLNISVTAEMKWGHDTSQHNLITIPDIITKSKVDNRNIVSETVQNKLARSIGSLTGQINAETYLLDYLKTIGDYDSNEKKVKNLQFEFIPKGKELGGLSNIARESNIVIISYWNDILTSIARFGEIISAIQQINLFGDKIEDKGRIILEIEEKLSYGEKALGYSRQFDESTRLLIIEMAKIAFSTSGKGTFFRGAILKLLELLYGSKI